MFIEHLVVSKHNDTSVETILAYLYAQGPAACMDGQATQQ